MRKVTEVDSHQNHEELLRFVERFAALLEETGMNRMAARVFAYVLSEDSDRYTAAELASGMRVSRGAISGAVRVLDRGGLLTKTREPGSRADQYMIDEDDVWAGVYRDAGTTMHRFAQVIEEGIDLVGRDTRGGRRLRESQAYLLYMAEEVPKLVDHWHRNKEELTRRLTESE